MIPNPFKSGFMNHAIDANMTESFWCKTINQLRANNINIRIENANTLTPKPVTTQEVIIESTIKLLRHLDIGNT